MKIFFYVKRKPMLDLFFPETDPNFKKIGEYISNNSKNYFKTHDEICYKCKKTSKDFITHNFCKNKYSLEKIVTCFYYEEKIKKILLNFKYYHKKSFGKELGQILFNFMQIYLPEIKKENSIITFVPMHFWRKYFIKGYNQAEILAKNLSKVSQIPIIKTCKKIKNTKTQASTKSRKERLTNLSGSFKNISNLNIKNVLIIDDLITTGSTLEQISKCIKEKNPKIKTFGLVLARR